MFKSHQLYSTAANVTRKFLSNKNKTTKIPSLVATGGDIIVSGGFFYHKFTTPGSFEVTEINTATSVEVLVVAGGGGGGQTIGGGGGAGGNGADGSPGTTNSGGGGGGGGYQNTPVITFSGGSGGSGIVLVKYPI